jgi:hypothetical protein
LSYESVTDWHSDCFLNGVQYKWSGDAGEEKENEQLETQSNYSGSHLHRGHRNRIGTEHVERERSVLFQC